MTTIKKVKIFADDNKNNIYLIKKVNGETLRIEKGKRFFERLIIDTHWSGKKTFHWVLGTTPNNEVMKLLEDHLSRGVVSECSYKEAFPEKL